MTPDYLWMVKPLLLSNADYSRIAVQRMPVTTERERETDGDSETDQSSHNGAFGFAGKQWLNG